MKLSMTTSGPNIYPPVLFDYSDNVSHFHNHPMVGSVSVQNQSLQDDPSRTVMNESPTTTHDQFLPCAPARHRSMAVIPNGSG
jgi:hypothetical protein